MFTFCCIRGFLCKGEQSVTQSLDLKFRRKEGKSFLGAGRKCIRASLDELDYTSMIIDKSREGRLRFKQVFDPPRWVWKVFEIGANDKMLADFCGNQTIII